VLPAEWQQAGTVAVGEETEVSDADEASRQYVDQETAKKLHGRQRHGAPLVAVGVVLPPEGDPFAVEGEQSMVGDGYPVGIAAEVAEHLCRPAESRLGMDDPVVAVECAQESGKSFL
jgi:hypothetical protein